MVNLEVPLVAMLANEVDAANFDLEEERTEGKAEAEMPHPSSLEAISVF